MGRARVTLNYNSAAMRQLLLSPAGPVAKDLMRRGRAVQNRAKVLCPVDRGDLRNSIFVELVVDRGTLICVIGSRLSYAIFVHNGTGLYGSGKLIRPVRANVLAWPNRGMTSARTRAQVGGSMTFAMFSVGTPARPFLSDALPAAA